MNPDHIGFLDSLARQIDEARGKQSLLALVLVHAPCISRIDSLMGYRQGDEIAISSAQGLAEVLMPTDRVYRVDRSTLACVLNGLGNAGQAWGAAYQIVRKLGQEVAVGGHSIQATPAVGLALYPTHAEDADTLLQRATLAVQSAPRARDHIAVYDADRHAANQQELDLQSSLKRAIDDQELGLRFQPQMKVKTGEIVACEALSRWDDASLGSVSPGVFIRAAETAGWMPRITHWLLHACLRQQQRFGQNINLAINLSAHDLLESDLPALVSQALASWGLPSTRLILEVTETAMMEDDASLEWGLKALRQLGVRLSMDDFGTGYSSLARLKRVPLDEIKIDVSFVRDLTRNQQDESIVRSIIDLAHNLGIVVVAEGVENRETLNRLARMGCDIVQGYLISPPLTGPEFSDFLRQHQPARWASLK